ncbi:hypothetical protein FC959_16620 [Clostridium botulinum]|nr:hypothetical protein [Clostridium botulinum]
MKIRLAQLISLNPVSKGCFSMNKEFESDIIPHAGDKIGDSVWKDPYEHEVIEVVINYQENICYVTLESIELASIQWLDEWREMVKLHGWTTVG